MKSSRQFNFILANNFRYKLQAAQENRWQPRSGKLMNPGKEFYLRLAADSVREVNEMRDRNGLTYARKSMIQCGLALNTNGRWEVSQLRSELQAIIRKYLNHFDGEEVKS